MVIIKKEPTKINVTQLIIFILPIQSTNEQIGLFIEGMQDRLVDLILSLIKRKFESEIFKDGEIVPSRHISPS